MNTLPEWFTVVPEQTYNIARDNSDKESRTGKELREGLEASVPQDFPLTFTVSR